jgi:hypothetical protein
MEGETIRFGESTGGLVTGLASYLDSIGKGPPSVTKHLWVGWPGTTVGETQRDLMKDEAMKQYILPFFSPGRDGWFLLCNKANHYIVYYFPSYVNSEEPSECQTYQFYLLYALVISLVALFGCMITI